VLLFHDELRKQQVTIGRLPNNLSVRWMIGRPGLAGKLVGDLGNGRTKRSDSAK
jgi:hypothetical protein